MFKFFRKKDKLPEPASENPIHLELTISPTGQLIVDKCYVESGKEIWLAELLMKLNYDEVAQQVFLAQVRQHLGEESYEIFLKHLNTLYDSILNEVTAELSEMSSKNSNSDDVAIPAFRG